MRAQFAFEAVDLTFEFVEGQVDRLIHVVAAFFAFDGNAFVDQMDFADVTEFFDRKGDLSVEIVANVFANHTTDLFVSIIP